MTRSSPCSPPRHGAASKQANASGVGNGAGQDDAVTSARSAVATAASSRTAATPGTPTSAGPPAAPATAFLAA
eukprot:2946037-Pyramimonas_sp.AAC.1